MEIEINENPQANQQTKKNRIFFAKLWINEITKEGENKGVKYMSGNIDNKFSKITIGINDQINIFKNKKREGKRDADYRVSLLTDQEIPEGVNGPAPQDQEVKVEEIDEIMAN